MLEWLKTDAVETAASAMEILSVVVIVTVIVGSTIHYLMLWASQKDSGARETGYRDYRHRIARGLLLSLEILVAADVIQTVVLEFTVENVLILGCLVLIRTFLNWTLVLEIEGHWPWQAGHRQQ